MGLLDKFKKKKVIEDEEVLKYSSEEYVIKDNYKNKDFFLKKLEFINQILNQRRNEVNDKNIKERYPNYSYGAAYAIMQDMLFEKINVLYVLGADFDVIKQNVEEYRDMTEKVSQLTYAERPLPYIYITDLLSLAYLYNINIDKLEFIKEKMIAEKYVDAILDILRNQIFENKILTTKDFYFKEKGYFRDECDKDSGGLMNAINSDNNEVRNQKFKKYLNEVKMKHHKRLINYYSKKFDEDKWPYWGSFDFRLTALAKIFNIDRDILKDSIFIASDLL